MNALTEKSIELTTDKKILFFKILFRYRSHSKLILNDNIKKSILEKFEKLPEKSKKWIKEK